MFDAQLVGGSLVFRHASKYCDSWIYLTNIPQDAEFMNTYAPSAYHLFYHSTYYEVCEPFIDLSAIETSRLTKSFMYSNHGSSRRQRLISTTAVPRATRPTWPVMARGTDIFGKLAEPEAGEIPIHNRFCPRFSRTGISTILSCFLTIIVSYHCALRLIGHPSAFSSIVYIITIFLHIFGIPEGNTEQIGATFSIQPWMIAVSWLQSHQNLKIYFVASL